MERAALQRGDRGDERRVWLVEAAVRRILDDGAEIALPIVLNSCDVRKASAISLPASLPPASCSVQYCRPPSSGSRPRRFW
jgi:hypothetical protein